MGATWFHHEHRHFIDLLKELEIPYYEQYLDGKAFFQSRSEVPAEAFAMPDQAPSYRLEGGSQHLIEKLIEGLDNSDIILNSPVNSIEFSEDAVKVNDWKIDEAPAVVLALPPKLWEQRISFSPNLPNVILETAQKTQTWMEESVKIAVIYNSPFWREKGLSGTLFSNVGPMTELYDHCDEKVSRYALCGFLHPNYKPLKSSQRQKLVIEQLKSVFGSEAASIADYRELNWSDEEHTSGSPGLPLFPHQNNGHQVYQDSLFQGRLFFAGTETSPLHGGYMEGAVYSANQMYAQILRLS
jgi:monoamine oxidase